MTFEPAATLLTGIPLSRVTTNRSGLTEFASQIHAVTVRISDDAPHKTAQRHCEIEVMTTHAGQVSTSSVGVNLFTLVDRAVEFRRGRVASARQGRVAERVKTAHRVIRSRSIRGYAVVDCDRSTDRLPSGIQRIHQHNPKFTDKFDPERARSR